MHTGSGRPVLCQHAARLQPYAKRTINKTTKEQKRHKPLEAPRSPSRGFSSFRLPYPRLAVFIASGAL